MFLAVLITFLFCSKIHAACIKKINVIGYTLVPNFSTSTKKYNVYISGSSVTFKAEKFNEKSIVGGLGTFNLKNDKEDFYIKCETETYKITVFKDYKETSTDNAYASFININDIKLNFDKNNFNYEVDSLNEEDLKIDYELEDSRASSTLSEITNEEEHTKEIVLSITSFDKEITNVYKIKINNIKPVYKEEVEEEVKDFNLNQKAGLIFIISLSIMIILNFIRRKMF